MQNTSTYNFQGFFQIFLFSKRHFSVMPAVISFFKWKFNFYTTLHSIWTILLTYLATTICYSSWPQLICDAIYHALLQLGANFGFPYLLPYLAITICYSSWPQLICDAIHHALLQLGANFGFPALLNSHPPVWPKAEEALLFCDFHHLAKIRRLYELGCSYPRMDMTQPSKTLYFNTLHYVDVIVYIIQLLVPSYGPFSSIAERSINLT